MRILAAFIAGMRPRQWTKNLVILLGILFAQQATNWPLWQRSLAAFAIFCLLSGCIYLFNDRMDLAADRRHPLKRRRPLASGRLPLGALYAGLALLAPLALLWSWRLGFNFFLLALVFFLINLLYSMWLKHQVLLDVFGIAINFVLRAVAGVVVLAEHVVAGFADPGGSPVAAENVLLSPWLLVCTFFGSLFLAFAKRRSELLSLDDPGKHRPVLALYTPALLDQLLSLSAGTVILAYALYTLWPNTVARYGLGFLASNLCVDFAIMRYLFLVYRRELGGDPSELLFTDKPMLVAILIWLGFVIWKVGLPG